ncbi:MAG: cytochrome b N-terminal domain-containing protein [Ardenticatenaceae bacterium]|nr:cytochrome b N-terminal domain-containing protein [Anaerolineales bacterium]MCB8922358.1 cytochrome b N-terminal domain-containing protein [Ardenticatenaceae bacterium]MCB9005618.1 cytochrome b N-terminal domain-containing protein [Ardenticatenaceae bacterium]
MAKRASFFHHLHPPHIPVREGRWRYTFGLGGTAVYLFILLALTGTLEVFYYIPSAAEANPSLQSMITFVPYGWLVRSLHYWAAQAMVVISVLHLLRVVFTGAYKRPRQFNWLLGLGLLVLLLLANFTGYALRWDADIAWALMVGTNLLRSIPLIGPDLYGMAVGSSEIGAATVVRLYGWHLFGLILAILFLIGWHIFRVRRDGGISRAKPREASIHRDELVRREAIGALAVTIVLLVVALLFPPALGEAADFGHLPPEASAPWFFLWVQQLLRLGPPLWMGVIVPLALLAVLALLPYAVDRRAEGVGIWFSREGRVAQWLVVLVMAFVLGFILLGAT